MLGNHSRDFGADRLVFFGLSRDLGRDRLVSSRRSNSRALKQMLLISRGCLGSVLRLGAKASGAKSGPPE